MREAPCRRLGGHGFLRPDSPPRVCLLETELVPETPWEPSPVAARERPWEGTAGPGALLCGGRSPGDNGCHPPVPLGQPASCPGKLGCPLISPHAWLSKPRRARCKRGLEMHMGLLSDNRHFLLFGSQPRMLLMFQGAGRAFVPSHAGMVC